MQSDASQCTWSKEDLSCSLTNPPSDPVFTILVALLTMILSIPVLVFLSVVLEEFASKTPGLIYNRASKNESRKEKGNIEEETAKLRIHQSDFARVIRKTVEERDGQKSSSKSDTAHYAYAGGKGSPTTITCCQTLISQKFFMIPKVPTPCPNPCPPSLVIICSVLVAPRRSLNDIKSYANLFILR